MQPSYESFLSSEVFRIHGPEKGSFYIHGGLLSKRSEGLAVHVNGDMLEAETKEISIKDLDGDIDDATIMRFIEFAYTGDYTVPAPDLVLLVAETEPQASDDVLPDSESMIVEPQESSGQVQTTDDNFRDFGESKAERKKKKIKNHWSSTFDMPEPVKTSVQTRKKDELWSLFCAKATVKTPKKWRPQSRQDDHEDLTRVMLCHVKLYVFSNRWQCEDLRDLVLQKLRLTLSIYQVTEAKVSEIVALIHQTYKHTHDYDGGKIDTLRDLVTDFALCHIETIIKDEDFQAMLTEAGALSKDLMIKFMQRID